MYCEIYCTISAVSQIGFNTLEGCDCRKKSVANVCDSDTVMIGEYSGLQSQICENVQVQAIFLHCYIHKI